MIATDACGQGSCLYGKTRDHVLELTTVLPDGTRGARRRSTTASRRAKRREDRVGTIHRLVDTHPAGAGRRSSQQRFPKLNRCLTGYDLAHIRDAEGRFNLNAVLCGAEGTLGLRRGSKAQRAADPPSHGACQRTLRQL